MKDLKGTRTEANLMSAFAGETQAFAKYTYYASKAKQDGYEQIAAIFNETASQEREHAELWFKYLKNGIPDTSSNLNDAASGEHFEWVEMYAEFARAAREEGFNEIAALFERVASVEKSHEDRYRRLIGNMENGLVFSREGDTVWQCRNCGHIHIGKSAPQVCPVCKKPQGYFEIKAENY